MDFNGDLVSDLPVLLAQQNEPFRRHVACALAKERGVSPKSHLYLADGTAMRDASRDAIWFGNTKQEALVTPTVSVAQIYHSAISRTDT